MTATIILLNGTSSSGKTTIAKQLQQQLPTPFMHVQVDTFAEMLPEGFLENGDPELRRATGPKLISGYHRALAALAEAGNDLIVDHVIPSPKWFAECVTLFAPYRVLFVGVIAHSRSYSGGNWHGATGTLGWRRCSLRPFTSTAPMMWP